MFRTKRELMLTNAGFLVAVTIVLKLTKLNYSTVEIVCHVK